MQTHHTADEIDDLDVAFAAAVLACKGCQAAEVSGARGEGARYDCEFSGDAYGDGLIVVVK